METLSPSALINALTWRYAVKKFDSSKRIPSETWQALENSLVLTPSSYGLQPWKFLVITDQEIRKKLIEATWNQSQVIDCSHYVVFAYKKKMDEAHIQRHIERTAEVKNLPLEKLAGFKKMMIDNLVKGTAADTIDVWASRQSYIALGNFMTSAAMLGVDTCPIEGLEAKKYDKILNLEESGFTTACACAAGYRSAEDRAAIAPKVRFLAKEVVVKR